MATSLIAGLVPDQPWLDQLEYVDNWSRRMSPAESPTRPACTSNTSATTSSRRQTLSAAGSGRPSKRPGRSGGSTKTEWSGGGPSTRRSCDAEVERYVDTVLSPDEYKSLLEADVLRNRQLFPGKPPEELAAISHGTVCLAVRGRVKLPSFRQYAGRTDQPQELLAV